MTPEQIGATAGKIWEALSEKEGQTVPALEKALGESKFMVSAALGWLAKEGKLKMEKKGNSIRFSLL